MLTPVEPRALKQKAGGWVGGGRGRAGEGGPAGRPGEPAGPAAFRSWSPRWIELERFV